MARRSDIADAVQPFSISVTGMRARITPEFRAHCEERIHALTHIFEHIQGATVAVRKERNFYVVEITLHVSGLPMRSQERADSLRTAFEVAMDKLKRRLRRYKERLYDRHRRSAVRQQGRSDAQETVTSTPASTVPIARVKRFEAKPMQLEEAALQMELLGHDFFVFINADTELVSVLYRRHDGKYGLIELVS